MRSFHRATPRNFIVGLLTCGVLAGAPPMVRAQPAPPAAAPDMPPGAERGDPMPMRHGPWGGPERGEGGGPWGGYEDGHRGMGGEMRHHGHEAHREMMRAFALVYRAEDKKLTPPDVQKIVEAFLLWNGNHSWKVINVTQEGEVIGFDLATAEGGVIARFTMDPKTGRPRRRG